MAPQTQTPDASGLTEDDRRRMDFKRKLRKKRRADREDYVEVAGEELLGELRQVGIEPVEITGRAKHFYSIYEKMTRRGKEFNEIFDLTAMRVLVDTDRECYGTIGMIHALWKPMPGRFKDYIAIPRINGYQSLHTTLFGPNGVPLEVQIRTEDMHRLAENGIAAHWQYKSGEEGGGNSHERAREWLAGLVDMQDGSELIKPKLSGDDPKAITMIVNSIHDAFFREIVEADELQAANSLLGFGANIGYIIGASTAGVIVNTAGAGWAILTNAATFLVAGFLVWQLRSPRQVVDEHIPNESIIHQMKEGWREFKSREWLIVIVAAFALSNMCFEGYLGVLAPLRMKEAFNGASSMSWLLTAFSVGSVAGVLLSIRVNPRRPLVAAMALFPLLGVLMLGTGIALPLVFLMPLAFLGGIALDMFWVLWITTMQREIPDDLRGRIGAYDAFGSTVFAPLGLFVAGPVAAWISSRTTLLIAGTVVIVASSATLLSKGVRSVTTDGQSAVSTPDSER